MGLYGTRVPPQRSVVTRSMGQFEIGTRALRRAVTVIVLMAYLFAGALHGFCGLDVTTSNGSIIVSLTKAHGDTADKAAVADHHCHGCFAVSMPSPFVVVATAEVPAFSLAAFDIRAFETPRVADPPPRNV